MNDTFNVLPENTWFWSATDSFSASQPAFSPSTFEQLLAGAGDHDALLSQHAADEPPVTEDSKGKKGDGGPPRIRSCAPCRVRRVKCDREPGSVDCIKCKEKRIKCTAMPPSDKKKMKERGGKRIEAARALFGDAQEAGESGEASTALQVTRNQGLQPSSLEGHLNTSELQGAVVSTLLDAFLETCSHTHITLISETTFRENFDRAGRRLAALDDQSQVLYHVAIALAARHTDSPLLVGPQAPKTIELGQATQIGMDLRPYGIAREGACRALTEKAMQMADEKATLRTPTVEALASLLLIEGLMEQNDLSDSASRPYAQAATSHTRRLMEDDTPSAIRDRVAGNVMGYTAYVRDAFTAATTGRSPSFSDDDLLLLREGKGKPPSLRVALQTQLPHLGESFWQLFNSFIEGLATNATNASKKLTGVIARRSARLNVAFGHEYLDQVGWIKKAYPELLRRLGLLLDWVRSEPNHPLPRHIDYLSMIRGLRLSGCAQPFLLLRVVGQRVAARPKEVQSATITEIGDWPTIDGPGADDETYWSDLLALQSRAALMAFESAREIAVILKDTMDAGVSLGSGSFQDARGTQLLFTRLTFWTTNLLNMPVIEQGGQVEDWTFGTKIETLTWILNAVHSIGWAFEKLGRPAPWLKGEIEKLQLAQAVFYSSAVNSPTTTATLPGSTTFTSTASYEPSPVLDCLPDLFPISATQANLSDPTTTLPMDDTSFMDFGFGDSAMLGGDPQMSLGQASGEFDFEAMLRSFNSAQ